MTSRYAKLASVAAVVLVALSFLFPGGNGIVPASIAWADVQEAVDKMHSARVTGTRDCFFSQSETPTHKLRVEKLFSISHGYVDRTFEDGVLIIEGAYYLPTGTVTVLLPYYKRYYRTQAPQEFRQNMEQVTPLRFFEWLFASGEHRQVGPKEVQGIQAVGFEVADLPERLTGNLGFSGKLLDLFFAIGPSNTCLWVDPETQLPIQAEAECQIKPSLLTGFQEMKLREVDDRWEFEAELDAGQFLPPIPDDYQELILPAP